MRTVMVEARDWQNRVLEEGHTTPAAAGRPSMVWWGDRLLTSEEARWLAEALGRLAANADGQNHGRLLPSGGIHREIGVGGGSVWSAESVPRTTMKAPHIRVASPVQFELVDLTAGLMQEALGQMRASIWMLDLAR